jgi:hypothetical protein
MNKLFNFLKFWDKEEERKTIGRLEYVNIPKLNLNNISAKIDTGAYRGAIHAANINVIKKKGKEFLQFNVLDDENPEDEGIVHKTSKFKTAKVRGTQSEFQDRYIIPVTIEIAGEKVRTWLSLTNRADLRHPILIGRRALRRFNIDVNQAYMHADPSIEGHEEKA